MAGKILVEITGDTKKFKSALGSASKDASSFGDHVSNGAGKALKGLAVGVGIVGGALAVGFGAALQHSITDLNAHQDASAQSAAAIKSTGDAANTTVPHLEKMADRIEKLSGMDDVAVQKGENMLLTFTNIRNEVGKGNNIFDQATSTLADMAAALGGDPEKNAIRLGKALNDPVKGISALTKVGVTFTEAQKKLIASLVKTGDTAGAQKVILHELNREFGGSAAAAGETLTGKINILKARLEDMGDAIFSSVIPKLTSLVGWFDKIVQAPNISVAIKIAWDGIKGVADNLWQQVSDALTGDSTRRAYVGSTLIQFRNDGQGLASKFWEWAVTQIGTTPTRHVVVGGDIIVFKTDTTLRDRFTAFIAGEASKVNWATVAKDLVIGVPQMAGTISVAFGNTVADALENGIRKANYGSAKGAIVNVGKLIAAGMLEWGRFFGAPLIVIFDQLAPTLRSGGERLATAITGGIKTAPAKLEGLGGDLLNKIQGVVTSVATTAYNLAISIGSRIADGVLAGITSLPGRLASALEGYVSSAVSFAGKKLHGSGDWQFTIHEIGEPMVDGIIAGIANKTPSMRAQLITSVRTAVADAKSSAMSAASDLGGTIGDAIQASYASKIAGISAGPVAQQLAALNKQITDRQNAEQLTGLQATLASAQAGTDGVVDAGAVQAAQQALDDWTLQQQANTLSAQLDAAKTSIQAEADARSTAFQTGLTNLQDNLNRGLISQGQYNTQLQKLLGDSGQTYATIGDSLGSSFANGFRDQIKALAGDVSTILSQNLAIKIGKKITSASIAVQGASKGFHGFASGGIVKGGRGGVLGMIGEGKNDELISPLPKGGLGGGGDTYIFNGHVWDPDALVDMITNAQIRRGRNTTGGYAGGLA